MKNLHLTLRSFISATNASGALGRQVTKEPKAVHTEQGSPLHLQATLGEMGEDTGERLWEANHLSKKLLKWRDPKTYI